MAKQVPEIGRSKPGFFNLQILLL